MPLRNFALVVAAAVSAVLVLSGCSAHPTPSPAASTPLSKVNAMTPEESVQFVKQYADAVKRIVGSGWELGMGELNPPADGHTGDSCTLPDGRSGVQYTLVWSGPPQADPQATIEKIQAEWKALGEDLQVEHAAQASGDSSDTALVLSDPAYLTGTRDDGFTMTLRVSAAGVGLKAVTHCVRPLH